MSQILIYEGKLQGRDLKMIKSMTGYGRGEVQNNISFTVEIRTVNHRFLDIHVRLPRTWLSLEEKIKRVIRKRLKRGKVDIYVNMVTTDLPINIEIDKMLLNNYYKKLTEIKQEIGFEGPISLSLLSMLPDLFLVEEQLPKEDELWNFLYPALIDALDNLIKMRRQEGKNLWSDISARLDSIYKEIELIVSRAKNVPCVYKDKLTYNLKNLCNDFTLDKDRVYTEIAILAEKSNITEEIVRLKSHLKQMKEVSQLAEPVGRRMDFIAQEMLREANTIASKSPDHEIIKSIVDIKSQIEEIREQIQNIE